MYYEKLQRCLARVREHTDFQPEIALVLGSGLGGFAKNIRVEAELSYSEIDDFPTSTVPGHAGKYIFGYLGDKRVVLMQGRVHYYEGYDMKDVVLPVRLMGLLGAKVLILTNAAGGIRRDFAAGDFMLITDQIASFVPSPLTGPNADALGERFPDMSRIYSPRLQQIARYAAAKLSIPLKEGVYIQFSGPQYESPAEIRMAAAIGADAVGMSTACEAVAANHMGMEICGISCISNMAAGILDQPLSHKEVQEAGARMAPQFEALVKEILRAL